MRVLVCGGRDFADRDAVFSHLDALHAERGIDEIIEGGASGADRFALEWCVSRRIWCRHFAANWTRHGRAAGPIRNREMLDEGKPDVVIAFPGGRGTADMVRQAEAAGVPIVRASLPAPSLSREEAGTRCLPTSCET